MKQLNKFSRRTTRSTSLKLRLNWAVLNAALAVLALVAIVPLIWMACASFKPVGDDSLFLPLRHLDRLTLDNFRELFRKFPFGNWLVNSLFLASLQTMLVVTFSSLAGFALCKYRFPGRRMLMLTMLATMLMPGVVLIPASWMLMYHLGWLDSYAAIVLPGAASSFGTFLFMQAMKAVPDELLQAGRIDGCSEFRLWWEVALPIVRPMTGAFTLLSFVGAWNSYLWPSVVLQDAGKYTLPIGLANMAGLTGQEIHSGVLLAGTLLAVLPVMLLFFVMQRDFIAGLASGAVKG